MGHIKQQHIIYSRIFQSFKWKMFLKITGGRYNKRCLDAYMVTHGVQRQSRGSGAAQYNNNFLKNISNITTIYRAP